MAESKTNPVIFEYPDRTCITSTRIVGPTHVTMYCLPCFNKIPKNTNDQRLVLTHVFTNGPYGTKRKRECIICNTNLLITRSVDECGKCFMKHMELLEKLPQGYDLNKVIFLCDLFTGYTQGIPIGNSKRDVSTRSTSIPAKDNLHESNHDD